MKKETVAVALAGLVLGFVMGLVTPKLFNHQTITGERPYTPQTPPADMPAQQPTVDQFEHAIKEYKTLLDTDPKNVEAWFQLGNIYYGVQENQQAVEYYNKALEIEPQHIAVLTQLGNLYFDIKQYQKAVDCYQRVLAVDPTIADVRVDMAVMYRRLKQPDKAIAELKKVIKETPGHATARINLGIILRDDKHDYQGAIAAWQEFLDNFPDHPMIPRVKEWIQKTKGLL